MSRCRREVRSGGTHRQHESRPRNTTYQVVSARQDALWVCPTIVGPNGKTGQERIGIKKVKWPGVPSRKKRCTTSSCERPWGADPHGGQVGHKLTRMTVNGEQRVGEREPQKRRQRATVTPVLED